MTSAEQEINNLRLEITLGKLMIKKAIRNRALFAEVREMTLQIKQLESKLDECLTNYKGTNNIR